MRDTTSLLVSSFALLGFSVVASAQQDVVVDSAHHKLEFENNCVRVVRAIFGPGEKSTGMFDTKDAVIVDLTGSQGFKLTLPDGQSISLPPRKPGEVHWAPGGRIQPENGGTTRVEYLAIELKNCS